MLEQIMQEAQALSPEGRVKALEMLRALAQQELEQEMDALIDENMPALEELAK